MEPTHSRSHPLHSITPSPPPLSRAEKPLENTPCTQIATGGERYLYFPEKNDCCSCCTFESGCSPVSADWLTNATFVRRLWR